MADPHLNVGVRPRAAPLRPHGQQQVAGLYEPAFSQTQRDACALCDDDTQAYLALCVQCIRMLEIDQAVGRIDILGQLEAGARRHGKVHRNIEPARHVRV